MQKNNSDGSKFSVAGSGKPVQDGESKEKKENYDK